jgi:beta-lactamase regulating signal transducer with metallopeptidase domain
MIASWMLYALLVSALVAAGAWLLEEVVRQRGGPVRFLWLGALLATVAFVAAAPLRTAGSDGRVAVTLAPTMRADAPSAAEPGGPLAAAQRALRAARAALARPLNEAAALGDEAGTALGVGWLALSAALLALAAATALRARRARRAWHVAQVAEARVRVAPGTGPAVLGVLHPEVVVPAWLLDAPEDEQRLVVMHEREHVRARDPLVLAAGCVAAALVPWSPAAWWMLLRLRAAVELDCDRRVLRRGVARHAYGTLLISMAGRGPGLSLGTPALAGSPSTLERRIRAMNARLPRLARLRAGALGILGLALFAGACESPLPTTAEVEAMDVASLERRAMTVQAAGTGGNVTYYVDGKQVTPEEARALAADRIAQMDVSRAQGQGAGVVHIYTKSPEAAASVQATGGGGAPGTVVVRDEQGMTFRASRGQATASLSDGFDGLIVVDGQVVDRAALNRLSPDAIERVEVIKGAAATRVYSDPRAANGVIRITTRAAGNQ